MEEYKFNKTLLTKLESIYAKDGFTPVNEKDIAKAMGMSAQVFSKNKKNKRIPYRYLIPYCLHNNVNINWVIDSDFPLIDEAENTQKVKEWTKSRQCIISRFRAKYSTKPPEGTIYCYNKLYFKSDIEIYKHFYTEKQLKPKLKLKPKIIFWLTIGFIIGFSVNYFFAILPS